MGGFGIPAARTICATARARSRNAGVAGVDGIGVLIASRGVIGPAIGVALVVAPEVGAASVPQADRTRPIRTTAGPKYAQHLAARRMGIMLIKTRGYDESLHWPSWAEYPPAPARHQATRSGATDDDVYPSVMRLLQTTRVQRQVQQPEHPPAERSCRAKLLCDHLSAAFASRSARNWSSSSKSTWMTCCSCSGGMSHWVHFSPSAR